MADELRRRIAEIIDTAGARWESLHEAAQTTRAYTGPGEKTEFVASAVIYSLGLTARVDDCRTMEVSGWVSDLDEPIDLD